MEDAWGWIDKDKDRLKDFGGVGEPMQASIKPSSEQTAGPLMVQSPIDSQLTNMAVKKGIESTAKGIDTGLKVGLGNTAGMLKAPLEAGGMEAAEAAFQAADAAQLAGQGLSAAQTASTLAATGAEGATAANILGSGAGATALGTATGGAASAGGGAALAALGPVGLTIGGLMLAKKLKIF